MFRNGDGRVLRDIACDFLCTFLHDETAEAAHSDEIILPKAKADAAGVKVSIVEPAPFQQVIKTSGQVLAAQGDESVAVATVAGVVSFRGKVTEGMSVGSGTPLVTISSHNIADGDPVQRARIAYEVSKKEYERMKALVKNKIVSDKDFVFNKLLHTFVFLLGYLVGNAGTLHRITIGDIL